MSQNPNDMQVGGTHYKSPIQHWDFVASNNLDYFQGQITKYVARWKNKGGMQDLLKARHFLDKYIDLQKTVGPVKMGSMTPTSSMYPDPAPFERTVVKGELHPSIAVPGKGEVTMGKFCTCASDPMFCALHEAGPTAGYTNQG